MNGDVKGKYVTITDSAVGHGTQIWHFVNIYRSTIGDNCTIGSHVTIGEATIGSHCKIEDHVFIPPGVTLGNHVFVGPHTCFTNDKFPRATSAVWQVNRTVVQDGASIGANSTILSGITIGEAAMVGAGSVVTRDVPPATVVYGQNAKTRGTIH